MYVSLVILLFAVYASAFDGQSSLTIAEFKDTRVVETIHEVCELTGYEVIGLKWTRCSKGRVSIKGCALECGVKLLFGEKYVDDKAEWLCEKQGEQDVILRPISCVYHGKVVPLGKTFSSGSFYYTCAKRPNGLGIDAIGCKSRDGRFVPLGDKFKHGNFVFQCYKEDKKVRISGVECVDKHGVTRKIGESWRYGSYYYECDKKGKGALLVRAVACSDLAGVRVEPGDEFVNGPTAYKCVEQDGHLSIVTAGCYAKDHRTLEPLIYPFGGKWFEAYGEKFGYIMQCTRTDVGVTRRAVECALLRADGQYYFLSVGCGTEVDRRLFACKIVDEKGHVAARLTKRKEVTLEEALSVLGVKQCKLRAQPKPNDAEYPELKELPELPGLSGHTPALPGLSGETPPLPGLSGHSSVLPGQSSVLPEQSLVPGQPPVVSLPEFNYPQFGCESSELTHDLGYSESDCFLVLPFAEQPEPTDAPKELESPSPVQTAVDVELGNILDEVDETLDRPEEAAETPEGDTPVRKSKKQSKDKRQSKKEKPSKRGSKTKA